MREGQRKKNDMLEKALLQAAHSSRLGTGFEDVGLVLLVLHNCFMQLSQIGPNHLWAESYSSYYKNKKQVELSGCWYRLDNLTAIDSENVELGA